MDVWITAHLLKEKVKRLILVVRSVRRFRFLVLSFVSRVFICVSEAEADSESTMHYVIGAILYRTLGLILPAPK